MDNKNLTKDTVQFAQQIVRDALYALNHDEIKSFLEMKRIELAELELITQPEMTCGIISAHKELCKVKEMHEKAAFGQNPAIFYALALCSECGELGNKLIKVFRMGESKERIREAIASEIADCLIYAVLLAYMVDINPHEIVEEKNKIVIQRAVDGYYGGPLPKGSPGSLMGTQCGVEPEIIKPHDMAKSTNSTEQRREWWRRPLLRRSQATS